jgi:solute carrier family 13 (sodium-dependent dicarboxylate transporter), member 2/3/5
MPPAVPPSNLCCGWIRVHEAGESRARTRVQWAGLVAGPVLCIAMLLLGPPDGFAPAAWRCAAVALLMVTWWATEALPLGATSLLPIVLFPLLGLADLDTTAQSYGSSILFLLLGASLVALAVERSGLHRRLAYAVLQVAAGEPRRIVLALMVASALLSMWVSNLATALMMLPVALGLAACVEASNAPARDTQHFTVALLLGVGYAATIGGMATIVGTPTNGLIAGIVTNKTGVEVTFANWIAFGLPIAVVLIPAAWWWLTRRMFPFELAGSPALQEAMVTAMRPAGGMSAAEKRVAVIFVITALSWVTALWWRKWPPLAAVSDAAIAIAAATALFIVPASGARGPALLAAGDLRKAPWEVLLLLGASLALSSAMDTSGLSKYLVSGLGGLSQIPLVVAMIAVVGIMIAWTEVATNASAAATIAPALIAVAAGAGFVPALLLLPAALAASCGYALPIGTPANTAVYATQRVPLPQFVRAGLGMDVIAWVTIVVVSFVVMPRLFAG